MKKTFAKICKYCPRVMQVETKRKEVCFDCKIKRQKAYNKQQKGVQVHVLKGEELNQWFPLRVHFRDNKDRAAIFDGIIPDHEVLDRVIDRMLNTKDN